MKSNTKNNKLMSTIFLAVLVVIITKYSHAADLTNNSIVDFSAGNTIKASDFNQNFTAIKDAINSKQNQITQNCASGSYVRQINNDGTVECELDQAGPGSVTGIVGIPQTGVISTTDLNGVVTIELDNNLLDANAIAAVKNNDGANSGIDADMLDGIDSSGFTASNQSCAANQAALGVDPVGNLICTSNITNITAASGLSGGGTAGAVSLSVNTATIQSRVVESCPPGESIRVINKNGSVDCEVDNDNGISDVIAGTHISKTGPIISPTLSVSGMPGIAFKQNLPVVFANSVFTTISTIKINAPASGFLLVNASGNSDCGQLLSTGFGPNTFRLDNTTVNVNSSEKTDGGSDNNPFSISYAFAAIAGNNVISLKASCSKGGGSIKVHSFNVIYTPSNYTVP